MNATPADTGDVSGTLHTLLRLRTIARESSSLALRKAEDERAAQLEKLRGVRSAVESARTETDMNDALDLANYYAFRLRSEMAERREAARLAQKERDVEQKRAIHATHVRDELAMDNVIDLRERQEAREQQRRESREMDEVAGRRHRDAR